MLNLISKIMKKIVFAVIATSATIIIFNYSCQKYNLNQDKLYDDEYHELAQVIIEDVEKFHRVYLEKGVHENQSNNQF